jgi:hypothetical protein
VRLADVTSRVHRGLDERNDVVGDAVALLPCGKRLVQAMALRDPRRDMVKSLFLCECLTREHRAPVVHAAAA